MLKLRNYQLESAQLAQNQNLLIADDCGLGKTATAIEAAKLCTRGADGTSNPFPRILVVCPKKIREQWVEQIGMQDPGRDIYIVDRIPVDLSGVYGWFIIHYDALSPASYLTRYVFDVVIADEAHRLRNKGNGWTKAIKRLTAARTIALTATPADKLPSEYWSILDFLHAQRLPLYRGFKAMYEEWDKEGMYPEFVGVKNLEKLQNLLSRYVVKHTKKEVAPELPEHIIIPTKVAMSERQQAIFDQINEAEDIEVPVDGRLTPLIIQNALVKIVRLQQVGSDPSLLDFDAPSGKLEWVDEFIADHPDQKIAIFTKFRDTADRIHEKYDAALVVGGRPPWRLTEFKIGELNLLVGTIAGMGIGLDLPMATYSIFVDMEWSTLQMQQAYDRIHRMNITEPKITYLLLSNRVDRLIYKTVRDKWAQNDLILSFLRGTSESDEVTS